ncbi:MAG: hypothetical protein IMZ46_04755, partial [Acidobacteria bacterium]|nr:hypothetical protein [Acidobacteriota bacterium]
LIGGLKRPRLAAIACPTLVVIAGRDDIMPLVGLATLSLSLLALTGASDAVPPPGLSAVLSVR